MALFEIKDLTFCYPVREREALTGINLTIEQGEYITICGKSGSGKTTLLRHLKPPVTPKGKKSGEVLFEDISGKERFLCQCLEPSLSPTRPSLSPP